MSDDGKCTCPGTRRVISSRERQKEWRARPEYKAASAAFLKKHPWCEVWLVVGIKVPATVVHHPNAWSYHSFELYIDFENNGAMAVSGTKGGGHYACHHNQKICPICKSKKCDIYAEGCQSCLCKKYPGLQEHIEKIKRDRMDRKNVARKIKRASNPKAVSRFPCGHRGPDQTCDRSSYACTMSAKTARGCKYFVERVKK
jgi:hypothetical protein